MHWKEIYEMHAEKEMENYMNEDVSSLLEKIQKGHYGRYHSIWYAVAERATADQAAELLYRVLKRKIDYLYRYHAAAALLRLLEIKDIEPVDLSSDNHDPNRGIRSIRGILKERGLL